MPNQNPTLPNLTEPKKKYLPIIVAIVLFMQILDATILNTALPAMAKGFTSGCVVYAVGGD